MRSNRNNIDHWAQRLAAREWARSLREHSAAVLASPCRLWRLEDLHAAMCAATGASMVSPHALAELLKKQGFKRLSNAGIRTKMSGQVRVWIIGDCGDITLAQAGQLYDEERANDQSDLCDNGGDMHAEQSPDVGDLLPAGGNPGPVVED